MIVVNFDDKINSKTSNAFIQELMSAIRGLQEMEIEKDSLSSEEMKLIEKEIERINLELNAKDVELLSSAENNDTGDEDDIEIPLFKVLDVDVEYPQPKVMVYFSSPGGDVGCAEKMLDCLNVYSEFIELIGNSVLYSSGFHIFELFEGKKRILNYTTGMLHQMQLSGLKINPGVGFDKFTRSEMEMFKVDFKQSYNKYKEMGLSKSKLNLFKKGEDVFFSTDELRKFFNLEQD